jgi:hypothetical protein
VNAGGLVAALAVKGEGARVEHVERAVSRPTPHQPVEIGEGIASDLLLGLRLGPGEEVPVPGRLHAGADPAPHLEGRQDVEERQPLHPARLVEREPVGDARAAIVAGDREPHMAERLHHGHDVAAHGALRIGLVRRVAGRRGGPAIAA